MYDKGKYVSLNKSTAKKWYGIDCDNGNLLNELSYLFYQHRMYIFS